MKPPTTRNSLAAAYQAAEDAYDNAIALSIFLGVISNRPQEEINQGISQDQRDYVRHNLINLGENVKRMADELAAVIGPKRIEIVQVNGQLAEHVAIHHNGHTALPEIVP